jgi:hypothetical protein
VERWRRETKELACYYYWNLLDAWVQEEMPREPNNSTFDGRKLVWKADSVWLELLDPTTALLPPSQQTCAAHLSILVELEEPGEMY